MIHFKMKKIFLLGFVFILFFESGCAPQTITKQPIEVTRIVQNTVIVTQVVFQVITATMPTLTETIKPTETPTQAVLPTETAVQPSPDTASTQKSDKQYTDELEEFSIWCAKYPGDVIDPNAPWKMTNEAHVGKAINEYTQVVFPNEYCVAVFHFGEAVNIDTASLSIYEYNQTSPWMKKKLIPVDGAMNVYYVVLDHPYIINPPVWFVFYQFKVEDVDRGEIWSRQVEFTRGWLPDKRCWDGSYPDPVSMKCPTPPEWEPIHTGFWDYKETVAAISEDE